MCGAKLWAVSSPDVIHQRGLLVQVGVPVVEGTGPCQEVDARPALAVVHEVARGSPQHVRGRLGSNSGLGVACSENVILNVVNGHSGTFQEGTQIPDIGEGAVPTPIATISRPSGRRF